MSDQSTTLEDFLAGFTKKPINLNIGMNGMWLLSQKYGYTLDQFNEMWKKAEQEVAEENHCLFKKMINEK